MNRFPKHFSTRELVFLIVCLVLILAFLPGGPVGMGVARVQSTLFGLVPLVLLGGGAYAFYRWWHAEGDAEPATMSRSRVCVSCGGEVADSWRMCPNCGHDLAMQGVFCRFCTYPMRSDWRICPSCTRPVSGAPASPSTA